MMKVPMRTLKTYLMHILPLFLVACLIVVVLTPVYSLTRQKAGETVSQSLEAQLEKEFTSFGQSVSALKNRLSELRYDTQTASLALQTDEQLTKSNYLPLYHVKKLLRKTQVSGWLEMQVLLQFRNNSTLLSYDLCCADKESIYPLLLGYKDLTYEQWQYRLFEEMENTWAAAEASIDGEKMREWITLNIYYSPKLATTAVFSILVPVEELLDKLLPHSERDASLCRLIDSRGNVLYDSTLGQGEALSLTDNASAITIDQERYLAFHQASDVMGMSVSIAVPERILYASVEPVMRMIYSIIFLALGCAALYCVVYAYVYFRPIVSLMEDLGCEKNSSRGISDAVRRVVTSLNADRERLKQEYAIINEQVEGYALQRALSGARLTPNEEALLSGETVFYGPYVLLLIEYHASQAETRSRFFAHVRTLMEPSWNSCQVVENERMHILLSSGPHTSDAALDNLLDMLNQLAERRVYLAVSAEHSGVGEISAAADEAETALFRAKLSIVNAVGRCHGAAAASEPFVIPFQKYLDVTASLSSGDMRGAAELLDSFRRSLTRPDLTPAHVQRALDNLQEAVDAAAVKLGGRAEGLDGRKMISPLQYLDSLCSRALMLCEGVTEQKGTRSDAQANQILAFIEENYTNSSFSLTTIAERFRLSEKYVSRFLKKQTGETYSVHIEQLRMEHARQLLTSTHLTIEEIASAVGYEHKNTFYKAFKRYFGCVPNELRGAV